MWQSIWSTYLLPVVLSIIATVITSSVVCAVKSHKSRERYKSRLYDVAESFGVIYKMFQRAGARPLQTVTKYKDGYHFNKRLRELCRGVHSDIRNYVDQIEELKKDPNFNSKIYDELALLKKEFEYLLRCVETIIEDGYTSIEYGPNICCSLGTSLMTIKTYIDKNKIKGGI